jgi:hypothetical protein
MKITGGCLCGAVRYTSTVAPIMTRACWCRLCQYIGAGSGTVNSCFPTESLTIQGATHDYRSIADSGNQMHRRFCPQCGVHLFSSGESRPNLTWVRAGTLDDPELARPSVAIWTGKAPSWACIDADMPRVEGQPAPPPGAQ